MSFKFEENTYYAAESRQRLNTLEEAFKKEVKKNLQFTYGTVTHIQFSNSFDMKYLVTEERNDVEFDIRLKAIPGAVWAAIKTIYHLACTIFVGGWDAYNGNTDTAKAYAFYTGRNCIEILGRAYSLYDPEHGLYLIEESQFHEKCYDLFFAEKAKAAKKSQEVNDLIDGNEKTSKQSKLNSNQRDNDVDQEFILNLAKDSLLTKKSMNSKRTTDPQADSLKLDEKPLDLPQKPNFAEKLENIKSGKNNKIKDEAFEVLAEECLRWDELDMGLKVIKEITYGNRDRKDNFVFKLMNRCIEIDKEKDAIKMLDEISYNSRDKKDEILFKMANTRLSNGDEKGAIELLDKLSSNYRDKKDEILFKMANTRLSNGDEKGAIELLDKLSSNYRDKKDENFFKMANTRLLNGNAKGALELLDKLSSDLGLRDKKDELIFKIAQWHFDQGQMDEALKVVDKINTSDNKERKAEFIVKVANTYVQDQLEKALVIMGSVKKDLFASQKFYLDLIEQYCPEGEGHDEAIIDIVRAFAIDSCKDNWSKTTINNFISGKIKSSEFFDEMHMRERHTKEAILNKFLSGDASNYCPLIRGKYEAKGRLGISEALAEIALSLVSLSIDSTL